MGLGNDSSGTRWLSGPVVAGLLTSAVLAAVVFGVEIVTRPPAYRSDLANHVRFAKALFEGGAIPVHPGLHVVTDAVALLTPLNVERAMVAVLVVAVCSSYLLTFSILHDRTNLPPALTATLAVVLGVVSAVWIPWFNENIYGGQGTPNVWHNPTTIVVVPFALGVTWVACRWLEESSKRDLYTMSGLLAISMPFKPSFAVVFAPALFVVVGVRAIGPRRLMPLRDVTLAMLPAAIVLAIQYQHNTSGKGGSISFDPLVVLRRGTPNFGISALLLLAFPVSVVLVKPHVLRDLGVVLSSTMVAIGFVERALLVETGRVLAGNWSWGYLIGVRLLFVFAAAAFLRTPVARWWQWLPVLILALHLVSGLIYAARIMAGLGYL